MEAEKIDIPEDLKALNPETQKRPIVIGDQGYMVYPLTEGDVEDLSQVMSGVMTDIFTQDMKCPSCKVVHRLAYGRKETCNRCKGKHVLEPMQKPPVEALTHNGRLVEFLEKVTGVDKETVRRKLTILQAKHIAAVLYEQNFVEDRLPEMSRKNFKALLGWIGKGKGAQPEEPPQIDNGSSE